MNEETTIINTSNNQLTCAINRTLEAAGIEVPSGWVYDNGAVIEFTGLGETCHVEMVHPNEVSDPERFVSLEKFNETFKGELAIPLPLGKKKFVVRHGHAGHNDPKATLEQAHDASLTAKGRDQAKQCGLAILKRTQGNLPNLKVEFSDLLRTMETAETLLQQFPEEVRVKKGLVRIEARENNRPIRGTHYWKKGDPMQEFAIDPFASLDKLLLLAPGKTNDELRRMQIENRPKNDPIDNPDGCIQKIGELTIDWSVYIEKLEKAYAQGKTFGQAASERTLFDIIFEIDEPILSTSDGSSSEDDFIESCVDLLFSIHNRDGPETFGEYKPRTH
jgi:hypothetical protein